MTEQKITHELKVSKPIMIFLWVMGIGLLTNLPVGQLIVPDAFAELSSNPTITLQLQELNQYDQNLHINVKLDIFHHLLNC